MRLIGILVLALGLAGCASSNFSPARVASALPRESGTNYVESQAGQQALQCVPYAREHSQIKIIGDAYTWWDQAAGRYERGANPAAGTVMVLFNYAGAQRGHVAVVRRVVSAREIRIDHANWLDDGAIYVNDPVVDVSTANDWSAVKIWNIKTGGWGAKSFPVQGFIGSGSSERGEGNLPHERSGKPNAPDDNDDDAADALTSSNDQAPMLVQRVAATPSLHAGAKASNAIIPAATTPGHRDPPAESGFALTADDLAIP